MLTEETNGTDKENQSSVGTFLPSQVNTAEKSTLDLLGRLQKPATPAVGAEIKSQTQQDITNLRKDLESTKRENFSQAEELKKKNLEIDSYLAHIEQLKGEISSLLKTPEAKAEPSETKTIYKNVTLRATNPLIGRMPKRNDIKVETKTPADTFADVAHLPEDKEVINEIDKPNLNDKITQEIPQAPQFEIPPEQKIEEVKPVATPEEITTPDDHLDHVTKMSGILINKYFASTESPLISKTQ